MDITDPSYRLALEFEIETWKGFKKTLLSQADREAFDELTDICRKSTVTCGNACNPIISKRMAVSITMTEKEST